MERSRTGLFFAVLLLCGCSTTVERDGPGKRRAPTDVADAVPKVEAKSKYGNPASYEVLGKRYYTLKTAAGFSQRGVASWYGEKFHGRKTSSGEVYDMYKRLRHTKVCRYRRMLKSSISITSVARSLRLTTAVRFMTTASSICRTPRH